MSPALVSAIEHPFTTLARWRRAWLGMDREARVVAYVQGVRGQVLLHVVYFGVLLLSTRVRPAVAAGAVVVLSACARWPQRRAWILGLSGVPLLFLRPFRAPKLEAMPQKVLAGAGDPGGVNLELLVVLAVAFVLLGTLGLLELQRLRRSSLVARRPVTVLVLLFFACLALACWAPVGITGQVFLWSLVSVSASSFWFVAYALADGKAKEPTPSALRLGYLRTYWGGSTTPVGKGPGYLRKFEARDASELAVTRLKALKLGVWAVILGYTYVALEWLVHGLGGLPTLEDAMARQVDGRALSAVVCWASLVDRYLLEIVGLAATGHVLVSMVRMAGYRIPRNTVRPLAARTLTEFWNRYYFYFKELLVDFFFFPVFLRTFKKWPRLRLAFATLCAASLGNWLYHFIRGVHLVPAQGLLGAAWSFRTYAVYSLVLAGGLIVSQLRQRREPVQAGYLRSTLLPRLNVALFFCLLTVLDDTSGTADLSGRMTFLLHLCGAA